MHYRSSRTLGSAVALVLTTVICGAAPASAGVKIGNDDKNLQLSLLLQGWGAFIPEGAPDGKSLEKDFYLRRMRLLFYGNITKWIHYFVETDSPNFGKGGDTSVNMFIQDAWVEFNLHPAVQISAGLILPPFSHHGMQGAVSLNSLDYHASLVKYPRGTNKVWRDWGAMIRGVLLKDRIEYRLSVTNGAHAGAADPRNPSDWPRLTGRLTINVFESESGPGAGGFFWDGIYLQKTAEGLISPRRILSFGVSVDWQRNLNVTRALGETDPTQPTFVDRRADYVAVAADVFLDLPLIASRLLGLTGQINFYYYDHGDRRSLADGVSRSFYGVVAGSEYSGYGLLSELGIRYREYGAIFSVDWFQAQKSDGDQGNLLSVYGGLNWWWRGHETNVKVQAGATKTSGGAFQPLVLIQVQLLL